MTVSVSPVAIQEARTIRSVWRPSTVASIYREILEVGCVASIFSLAGMEREDEGSCCAAVLSIGNVLKRMQSVSVVG